MSQESTAPSIEPRTPVFVCSHVASGSPVLYVAHDEAWQLLCGAAHDEASERPQLVPLSSLFERDPSLQQLGELADLSAGHFARRASLDGAWERSDATEAFILCCIDAPGWSVQCIEQSDEEPAFAYTVGLTKSFGHPELIVFGYPSRLSIAVLNIAAERIRDGARFVDGTSDADILVEYRVRFRAVRARESFTHYVGYALWYYEAEQAPFGLLQLVWPDRDHNYPDSPDAPAWLKQSQPLID
jgi:hypothetical protein